MSAPPMQTATELIETMPFAVALGICVAGAAPERVSAALPWDESRCTAGAIVHGGVLMSLADTVGAVCAFLNLPAGTTTATIESKTNFFRAVRGGTVHAVARPIHVGRSFIVVQTDLADDSGRQVGQTTQTQAVLDPARTGTAPPAWATNSP